MNQHELIKETKNSSLERVKEAIAALQMGRGVLVMDSEDRENEGDIIYSSEMLTEEQMAKMIRYCSGIVCICITEEKRKQLDLQMMVDRNTCPNGTNFTVSIDAREDTTTGVSAYDRVRTVQVVLDDKSEPQDLVRPGHMFPLVARPGGVLERPGHTEATIDLMRLAGLKPCGVLCELTNDDGTMSRLPEIEKFSEEHNMPIIFISDLVNILARN